MKQNFSHQPRENTQTAAGYTHRSGVHTWDRKLEYHQCEKCTRLFESRHDYAYEMGQWIKKLECPMCYHISQKCLSAQQYYRKEQSHE